MTFREAYASQRPPWEEEREHRTVFAFRPPHKEFIPQAWAFERLLESLRALETPVPREVSYPRAAPSVPGRRFAAEIPKPSPPPEPTPKIPHEWVCDLCGSSPAAYGIRGRWVCFNHIMTAYSLTPLDLRPSSLKEL